MKQYQVILALILTLNALALAYDPPEIIGELRGEPPDSQNFGRQFCWVGDQNGDGYDDILVNHDPSHLEGHVNAVKLYFGGEQIDNEPDLVFRGYAQATFGIKIGFLGHLNDENDKWMTIKHGGLLLLYMGGDELDTLPDMDMPAASAMGGVPGYDIGDAVNRKPSDFNADGYDDILVGWLVSAETAALAILLGGEDFDTLPDWSVHLEATYGWQVPGSNYITGGDLNGDGYDDFMVRYYDSTYVNHLALFLGAEDIDTAAFWEMTEFQDGERVLDPFTVVMLPDVNDDGYDDWGMYWQQSFQGWEIDGYYVYFGGEEPDAEPDLDLEGNHNIFGTDGLLSGGDFNGDGIGDIVTTNRCGYMYNGELHLYFGSQFIDESASIVINTLGEYGIGALGASLGSVGDFNDDGSDDFVINLAPAGRASGVILLLAGNAEWEVFVPNCEEKLPETLNFDIYPNPFNDSVKLRLFTARRGSYRIQMLSIRGSVVWETVINGDTEQVSVSAEKTPAGVYIFRCRSISSANKCQIQYRKAVLVR